ncbi:nuclear transport factor 2 family protein [Microvirga sp. STS02]|uniref:nuclear transport factor 2 family protein n=1 Tax=Hymenobacter negativus TaxID=2795026 RepID=UPI0018DD2DE7|nr:MULTISPECIES: nuclear transport factor 2 family protein [Bacteria]MBH8568529.1 nuclear transport factor 2 family protein [Hymenobacter negativus]MBR7208263.1 nuclear transport factor 2 family protein [Microvirga sp. STS02]
MANKSTLLMLVSLAAAGCGRATDEEAAIRQVLEREAATWRAGDAPGHAACWHIQPYSRILVSTAEGKALDIPPALMVSASPAMGQGGKAVQSNFKMSIAGNSAWVSHDEESTAQNGQKTFSHEIRLLEKIDNQWKLVGQSIHAYKP